MKPQFEVAAGSVAGREHTRTGKNNQDAFAWDSLDDAIVAVICDGCGSASHSEVGAQIGARIVVATLVRQLRCSQGLVAEGFWAIVQRRILTRLRSLAHSLGGSWEKTVQQYLLFTILGAVITPAETTVFGVGDGIFAINGIVYPLGPFAHNAPPYLAYHLSPPPDLPLPSIQVHYQLPTADLQTLLLGSDGILDLKAAAQQLLPGKPEPVGDLCQFWQAPYFRNPDRVRRRLSLINREVHQPDWSQQQLVKQPGLLPDDTTLVSIRRRG
jgi:serine/threonine protein phosphatase PrpC